MGITPLPPPFPDPGHHLRLLPDEEHPQRLRGHVAPGGHRGPPSSHCPPPGGSGGCGGCSRSLALCKLLRGRAPPVPNPPWGSPPLDPSLCAGGGWGGWGCDPEFGNKKKSFCRAVCPPVPARLGGGPSWVGGVPPWSIDPVGAGGPREPPGAALSYDWNLPTRRGLVQLGTVGAEWGGSTCGLRVSNGGGSRGGGGGQLGSGPHLQDPWVPLRATALEATPPGCSGAGVSVCHSDATSVPKPLGDPRGCRKDEHGRRRFAQHPAWGGFICSAGVVVGGLVALAGGLVAAAGG